MSNYEPEDPRLNLCRWLFIAMILAFLLMLGVKFMVYGRSTATLEPKAPITQLVLNNDHLNTPSR